MYDGGVRLAWLVVAGAFWVLQLAYVLLPFDILPDFIPFIGWTDDIAVVLTGLGVTAFGFWRTWPRTEQIRRFEPTGSAHVIDYEPLSPEEISAL